MASHSPGILAARAAAFVAVLLLAGSCASVAGSRPGDVRVASLPGRAGGSATAAGVRLLAGREAASRWGAPLPSDAVLADSGRPGPRLALVAGVHGDEISGSVALRRLLASYSKDAGAPARGADFVGRILVIEAANAEAVALASRSGPSGIDLNRVFPGDASAEGKRAAAIFGAVRRADLVLDLHEEGLAWPELDMPTLVTNEAGAPLLLDIIDELGRVFSYTGGAPTGSLNAALEAVAVPDITIEVPMSYPLDRRLALVDLALSAAMHRLGLTP